MMNASANNNSSNKDPPFDTGSGDNNSLYPSLEEVLSAALNETEDIRALPLRNDCTSTLQLHLSNDCPSRHMNEERFQEKMDEDEADSQSEQLVCPASTTSSSQSPFIEVCPGVFLKLRGSSETWEALQAGKLTNTTCQVCGLALRCIQDAEFVLCPDCRVVSPLQGDHTVRGGGMGLGLRMDE